MTDITEITTLDTVKEALLAKMLVDMERNHLEGAATWAGIYSQLVNADAQAQMTRLQFMSSPFGSQMEPFPYGGTDDD